MGGRACRQADRQTRTCRWTVIDSVGEPSSKCMSVNCLVASINFVVDYYPVVFSEIWALVRSDSAKSVKASVSLA